MQRSLKFARYLPDSGYRPIVITGPGEATGEWAPLDATLAAELDGEPRESESRTASRAPCPRTPTAAGRALVMR